MGNLKEYFERFTGSSSDIDDILKEVESKDFKNTVELPTYLTHCTYNQHQILEDKQLGGKKVLSGNVEAVFPDTHFSPIPLLSGHYTTCLVFNTKKLIERNPDKIVEPTFYAAAWGKDRDKIDYILYFNDDGWQKIKKKDVENCSGGVCGYLHEREWNIENPVKFDWEDIEGIISSIIDTSKHSRDVVDLLLNKDNPISFEDYKRIRENVYRSNRLKAYEVSMDYEHMKSEPYNTVIDCEGMGLSVVGERLVKKGDVFGLDTFLETGDDSNMLLDKCLILNKDGIIDWEK